jgi:G3E family GTPase
VSIFDRDKSAAKIPASLITGFLGSGKTTLLNHILGHADMRDSAVIVNEFGDVGLDHLFMRRIDGETVVMSSGCLCCTVRSDLESTLRDLMAKRASGAVPPFARVLIETTGLADPAPIVHLFFSNPFLMHDYRLDAVITTVDAVNGMRQLDEQPESVKQAAIADRLLLTKADLADEDMIVALAARLAALNPGAPMLRVAHGVIAPDQLFAAALFDPARKTPDVRAWLREEAIAAQHAHHHGHQHHDVNRHDARVRAFCLSFDAPLDWMAFNGWLAALRRERGDRLLRVKGVLDLIDEPGPVAIHGVHHVFHPPVAIDRWPEGMRGSRIVYITRDLERTEVEASYADFMLRVAAN